eukprot:4533679-Ditylum_brightwellii.AAC.1
MSPSGCGCGHGKGKRRGRYDRGGRDNSSKGGSYKVRPLQAEDSYTKVVNGVMEAQLFATAAAEAAVAAANPKGQQQSTSTTSTTDVAGRH